MQNYGSFCAFVEGFGPGFYILWGPGKAFEKYEHGLPQERFAYFGPRKTVTGRTFAGDRMPIKGFMRDAKTTRCQTGFHKAQCNRLYVLRELREQP